MLNRMNDPCNLSEEEQRAPGIGVALGTCEPSYRYPMTTFASDWADIGRVVDYIRKLRMDEQVSTLQIPDYSVLSCAFTCTLPSALTCTRYRSPFSQVAT